MSAVSTRYKGIQVLRAVLFVGIVAFHSGVPGSQCSVFVDWLLL